MNSWVNLTINKAFNAPNKSIFIGILFFANLVTIEYLESPIYTLIQYIFLMIILFYMLRRTYNIRKNDMCFILAISMMGVFFVFSSYIGDVVGYYLRASIYFALFSIIMCLFLLDARYSHRLKDILLGGKIYLAVVVFFTDLLMVLLPNDFYNISGRDIGTTLLGNKFNVAYAHLMLLFLSLFLEEKLNVRNKKAVIYAIIVAGICKCCDCTTAMLGCGLFLFLYFMPKKIKVFLSKPIVCIAVFFLCAFILFAFDGIMMLKPIQYFITNVLRRDATLTGRMQVYPYLFKLIKDRPFMGYGYGTEIVKQVSIWYANAQNGLLDFIIRYGWLAAVALIFAFFLASFKNYKNNKYSVDCSNWLPLIMIYVYMFMGIVEITYSKQFFFYIILLYACSCVKIKKCALKVHCIKNFNNHLGMKYKYNGKKLLAIRKVIF